MFTKEFWTDALERAAWTFAQTVLSIVAVLYPGVAITSKATLETTVSVVIASLPLIVLAGLGSAVLSLLKTIVKARKAA